MTDMIYGEYADHLPLILEDFSQRICKKNGEVKKETGYELFEHLITRIKTSGSMTKKCQRKDLPATAESALKRMCDSISLRIVYGFVDDIYTLVDFIHSFDDCAIAAEKDCVKNAKSSGYCLYYLIVEVVTSCPDRLESKQDSYSTGTQLRTIAMDSRASLEYQTRCKHDIKDPKRTARELKRHADKLASCDLIMQTIRNLTQESFQD